MGVHSGEMNKKNRVLWWIGMGLLLIAVTGCATGKAGIAKPDIPVSESCLLVGLSYEESRDGYFSAFTYDGIDVFGDDWFYGVAEKIVPAGKRKVAVSYKSTRRGDYSYAATQTRWTEYSVYETWNGVFDFEPGKYYQIKITFAPVTWDSSNNIAVPKTAHVQLGQGLVQHYANEDIEIVEVPNKEMGSLFIQPYASTNYTTKLFSDYIPGLYMGFGASVGAQLISGWLNMDLGIEGNAGGGFSLPNPAHNDKQTGVGVYYDYGAYVNFNIWRLVLGGGVGMGNGTGWYSEKEYAYPGASGTSYDVVDSYSSIPYAEAYLGFTGPIYRRSTGSIGLYYRHYFLETGDAHNATDFGLRIRF